MFAIADKDTNNPEDLSIFAQKILTIMKIKEGFKLRTICGENVISGEGTGNVNFSKLITLNETAAYLFGKLVDAGEFTTEQMADLLTEEYEVARETALADSEKLAAKWAEIGLLV